MGWFGRVRVVVLVWLAVAAATTAADAARIALVIGNDQYQNLPDLRKAVADAQTYAVLLEEQGFDEVILKTDLTRAGIDEAIATFLDKIAPGDTAVFAYSGHGWSDGAQNYLVATDAPEGGRQELLARVSIPLKNGATGILDDMDRRGAGLKVAIIDACRDNPFTAKDGTRSAGLSRGLVRIEPPSGTFVVFSAGTGQTALDRLSDDDTEPNSVFTRVFVPLVRSGLALQEATKTAQEQVVALARSIDHEQKPAYYDEVLGRACLSGTCEPATAAKAPPAAPAGDAASAYQAALAQNTIEAWDAFLKYHPDGFYADLARSARKTLGFAKIAKLPKLSEITPEPADPPAAAAETITECDRLAAIVLDPDKPVTWPGLIEIPKAEAEAAVAACRAAVAAHPDVRRFKGQLGFALKGAGLDAEAREWFEKAAADGHAAAMIGLSELYRSGSGGVNQDGAEMIRWIEKAEAAGSVLAGVGLLEAYQRGMGGIEKDETRAKLQARKVIPLLERASDAGDPDAPTFLGLLNLVGGGIDVDTAKGGAYLAEAIGRGSRVAAGFFAQWPDDFPAETRLAVEQLLADRGFSPGPVDGIIDDATKAALDAFSKAEPKLPAPAPQADTRAVSPAEVAQSYWNHNGSIVGLYAKGTSRVVRYVEPRPGMVEAGAKEGDIVFEGTKNGDEVSGTAYVFSSRCGRTPYPVAGFVEPGLTRIVLEGTAPTLAEDCTAGEGKFDELVFEYVSKTRPGASAKQ